jgi:hypothetical protein
MTRVLWTDEGFYVDSKAECSLVELVTLERGKTYTIRAVAQPFNAYNSAAEWGVYVNHHVQNGNGRKQHMYELAGFQENTIPSRITWAGLTQHLWSPSPEGSDLHVQSHSGQFAHPGRMSPFAANDGHYLWDPREIELTVHTTGEITTRLKTTTFTDPVRHGPLARPDREMFAQALAAKHGGTYSTEVADPIRVGLCAIQCSFWVRQLDIRIDHSAEE